jgi:hypothetical protein
MNNREDLIKKWEESGYLDGLHYNENIVNLTELFQYLKKEHSNLPHHVFETLGEIINDLKMDKNK